MENTFNIQAIAQEIKAAQDEVRQITPITSRLSGFDNNAGYDVDTYRVRDHKGKILNRNDTINLKTAAS